VTSRKGELYCAIFRRTNEERVERILMEHVGSPQAMAESLREDTIVFGEGCSAMEAKIRAALPPSATVVVETADGFKPSAVSVARLGMERLQRGDVAGDRVMPLYVQRPEAEIRFEQSGGLSPVKRRQERVAAKVAQRSARNRTEKGTAVRRGQSHGE